MKTEFDLEVPVYFKSAKAKIIGNKPEHIPYVSISIIERTGKYTSIFIRDKDLERFAVNILKAIKSKRLKNEKTKNKPY